MAIASAAQDDKKAILTKALLAAGQSLGLDQTSLGKVVGMDRSIFHRGGIAPETKGGELALLLIRCYRSLFALLGGDQALMRHWMHTNNLHTNGIPAQQVQTIQGLVEVVSYLDAIRGKV